MTEIVKILSEISHRPYELPVDKWRYYQEWNNVLFLHWKVPYNTLRNCVPANLEIDTFGDVCYVSLVAFTMEKIRPKYLPSVSFISDFHEINLRTYISNNNKKGVYFLSIEAQKSISVLMAKSASGLPYEKSTIIRSAKSYSSINKRKGLNLNVEFEVGDMLGNKSELDKWLTERYCLYLEHKKQICRYNIHHKEWLLKSIKIKQLNLSYTLGGINLSQMQPDLIHYSDGVKVIAWPRQALIYDK